MLHAPSRNAVPLKFKVIPAPDRCQLHLAVQFIQCVNMVAVETMMLAVHANSPLLCRSERERLQREVRGLCAKTRRHMARFALNPPPFRAPGIWRAPVALNMCQIILLSGALMRLPQGAYRKVQKALRGPAAAPGNDSFVRPEPRLPTTSRCPFLPALPSCPAVP